jgi:hypothetical protein
MAMHDVYFEADYYDAAERTSTKSYLMRTQYDDTDPTTWGDVVADAADIETALNVLTMAELSNYRLSMLTSGGGSANVAANNQVVAFTRIRDTNGDKGSFEVPAWDDVVFDENSQNLLSGAYNTAAEALALFLRNAETRVNFALLVDYTQSRTHKSRNIVHD